MMKKLIGILLFISATAFITRAQKTNFSGSWTIEESKSDFQGESPAVMYRMLDVKQTNDSIWVTGTRYPNPDNPAASLKTSTTLSSYPMDGHSIQTILPNGRKMTASIKFSADNKSMTRISSYSMKDDVTKEDYKSEEIWTLSDNGRSLTLSRTFTNTKGDITIIAVYEKQ